jgi:hypothetical protein
MPDFIDVSDETPRRAYTATSGQTAFAVPFVFFQNSDLQVYQEDVPLTLDEDYTVSGAESEDGGTVTLLEGATAGDSIVIARAVPYELTTHIPTSGDLDVPAINLQFSLFVAMIQQLSVNLPRSLRQPDSDEDDLDALPVAASRASKYLGFDADGQPTALASVSTSAAATAFWISVISTSANAAAARSALGVTDQSAIPNWHFCR